jgi:chromosome partitioning protein
LQIGGILKNMGRSVLIVDTDPQANATLGLGVYPESVYKNIYHYYLQQCSDKKNSIPLSEYIIKTVSGIDLIPSHLDLVGAESILYQNPERYHILSHGIAPLKMKYDHILIDTPPFLGQFLMNGMIASDKSVIVFSSDIFAIAGYDHLNLVISDIKDVLGIKIHIGMAILNRWMESKEKSDSFISRLASFFNMNIETKMSSLQEIRNQLESRVRIDIPEVVLVAEGKEISRSIKQGIPLITLAPDDPAVPGFTQASKIIDGWITGGQ